MFFDDQEEINVIGEWWIPGRKQSSHPGVLLFSREDGPSLKLFDRIGFLTKPEDGTYTDRSFSEFFPLVCGRTEIGPATLIQMRHGQANWLISNALFQSEDEAQFRRIRLQFQHFSEWVGQPIIHHTVTFWENEKKEPIGNEIVYCYRSLPENTFCANDLDFRIFFGIKTEGGSMTSVTLCPMVYLEIASPVSKSVDVWWFDVIRPVRDLLSFALDRPIDVSRFDVIDESETNKPSTRRVFFKGRKTDTKNRELVVEDMLFAKSDIPVDLGDLVCRWLHVTTELPMVCNLYSSVTSIREQYLEEEFLSLAQAAELYHRSRFNSSVLPKAEWKEKIRKILKAVPDNEQQWLKDKLIWSNAPTLQNRLEELLKELEPTASILVADRGGFAKVVKHTRNYFTHWDTKQQEKAASYPDLYFVSRTLQYLIAACLLRELSFSSAQTAELFKRNHHIHNFCWNSDNPISPKPGKINESTYFTIKIEKDSQQ